MEIMPAKLSEAYTRNGYEWIGSIHIKYRLMRCALLKQPSYYSSVNSSHLDKSWWESKGKNDLENVGWGQWYEGGVMERYAVEKQNGKWTTSSHFSRSIAEYKDYDAFDCASLLQINK